MKEINFERTKRAVAAIETPFDRPDKGGEEKRLKTPVLALDLGTNCGFAVRDKNGVITFGTKVLSTKYGRGQRWVQFRTWLLDLIKENEIEVIAFEDVKRHSGNIAAHVYGGLLAYTEEVADRMVITLNPHGVGVIKKSWCGKGNASKELMISAARERGYRVMDDNQADALAILNSQVGL